MSYTEATVQLLSPQGTLVENDLSAPYLPLIEKLDDAALKDFHRHMVVIRRFDIEAGNLQRQGQLALWIPSLGQEGAQVGSAFAARPQDHIFPAYREHVVGRIRGLDVMKIIEMLRGQSHGGWIPAETGNFHLYTLVIGSQSLHATGYAMGQKFDGADEATMVYFGDGASSQGDVSEADGEPDSGSWTFTYDPAAAPRAGAQPTSPPSRDAGRPRCGSSTDRRC